MNKSFFFWLAIGLLFSCEKKTATPYIFSLPAGFKEPLVPRENPMTREKAALGQLLFFDPILSDDSTIACASCHAPELAFTDGRKTSTGLQGRRGKRNAPTLVNVAYYPYFFSEGKVQDLETQAQAPGLHEEEMGTKMKDMIYRLRKNTFYRKKFRQVFHEEIDVKHFVYALACYERTLIAANSPYNRFYTTGDSAVLTADEKKGMELFFSDRTNCSQCHQGKLFTNFSFQNIGLYEWYEDPGLARVNSLAKDSGLFKTPTLLNVAYTAPYMHDGNMATLEDVIEFYNTGGKKHPNKSKWVKPLGLTEEEKKCLVSFLKTLTDEDLKKGEGIFKKPELSYQ